ncbi:MAG: tail protein X [Clostridia bacterium]|nr:tail protein X [Clostridia bacterium]
MGDVYKTVSGDTWDIIAKNQLGDEKYAQQLMEANWPLLDYMIFPANIDVTIPDIDETDAAEMPIWRD